MRLCALAAGVWFLLWTGRRATKDEALGLGVSVGGIPGWWSLSVWYGVACLLAEWGPPDKNRGALSSERFAVVLNLPSAVNV